MPIKPIVRADLAELEKRADLEKETVDDVRRILQEELEKE